LPALGLETFIDFSMAFCLQAADLLQIEDHIHAVCNVLASQLFDPEGQPTKSGIRVVPDKVLLHASVITFPLLDGALAGGQTVLSLCDTSLRGAV
jgi:hypothetical protein